MHRTSKTANQAFIDATPEAGPFSPKQAQALAQTFLTTRTGFDGEDLQRKLEHPEMDGEWFRLQFRFEKANFTTEPNIGFHGSHLEALHSLIAPWPASPKHWAHGWHKVRRKADGLSTVGHMSTLPW